MHSCSISRQNTSPWFPDVYVGSKERLERNLEMCVCVSHSVVSDSLQPHGLLLTSLLCPWNLPGKNTGMDSHFLLQESFRPRDRIHISYLPTLADWFFTTSTTWKASLRLEGSEKLTSQTELQLQMTLLLLMVDL